MIDPEFSNIRNVPGKRSRDWREGEVKPIGKPEASEDFQKVLAKDSDRGDDPHKKNKKTKDSTLKETAHTHERVAKKAKEEKSEPSIFAMAGEKAKVKQPKPEVADKEQPVFQPTSTTPEQEAVQIADINKSKDKINVQFSQEEPDLAYVNPMHLIAEPAQAAIQSDVMRPSVPKDILKLVEQMVKEITTMSQQGKTDTTITIMHPPLFEGATLKLTSFDTARGEFNIAFENLNVHAQKVLQDNLDSLKQSLENKGYVTHIITATTLAETPTVEESSTYARGDEKEEQQDEHPPSEKEK